MRNALASQPGGSQAVAVVGRYALYGEIAAGGMATVHIGRQLGPVGFARTVAIKRLHAHLAKDPDFVLMFLDEARIAARIRHPNVVPTVDVVWSEGELLLVMEYVSGESLSRLMRVATSRGERVPPRVAAAILSGTLHGLHAAHEAKSEQGEPLGVVHRDVSPQNVLVGTDGVARVVDFGVAKAIGRMQATRAGIVKGKIAYMGPEQVRGGDVDRRSDLYAAAVVLWEVLAGRRLFDADNDVQAFSQVLAGCSQPPSKYAPDLPRAFDDVTMRGLALDPGARWPTAREMARALEACAGVATPSEVGDWVESLAGALLADRARVVADIESVSSAAIQAPAPSAPVQEMPSLISDVRPSAGSLPEVGAAEPMAPKDGPARATLGVAIGSAAAAVAIAVALAFVVAGRLSSRSVPPALATASAASVPATASATESASATASATASSPTAAIASAAPSASAPRPAARPTATAPAAAPPAGCNPPWYFDANGVKRYKRECN